MGTVVVGGDGHLVAQRREGRRCGDTAGPDLTPLRDPDPEGPVAVVGSALGSKIGRFFRSGPERLRLLVACGAAAGISAAFNAPIAGVFFSLETAPQILQRAARVFPLTHFLEATRAIMLDGAGLIDVGPYCWSWPG